jgi:hypothetical protein
MALGDDRDLRARLRHVVGLLQDAMVGHAVLDLGDVFLAASLAWLELDILLQLIVDRKSRRPRR